MRKIKLDFKNILAGVGTAFLVIMAVMFGYLLMGEHGDEPLTASPGNTIAN